MQTMTPDTSLYYVEEPESVFDRVRTEPDGSPGWGIAVQTPSDRVALALGRVLDGFDSTTCEAHGCEEPVGFYLDEYEDDHGREAAREGFHPFVVVDTRFDGEPVAFLACEDCGLSGPTPEVAA